MKTLHMVAFTLMFVGALNWGLVGLFDFNLVEYLAEDLLRMDALENVLYILVGASAVYIMSTHMKDCKICSKK